MFSWNSRCRLATSKSALAVAAADSADFSLNGSDRAYLNTFASVLTAWFARSSAFCCTFTLSTAATRS